MVSREVSKRGGGGGGGERERSNWSRDKTRESFNNGEGPVITAEEKFSSPLFFPPLLFLLLLPLLFFFSREREKHEVAETGCAARANISSRLTLRRGKSASVFLDSGRGFDTSRSQHAGFRTFLRQGGREGYIRRRSRRRINSCAIDRVSLYISFDSSIEESVFVA